MGRKSNKKTYDPDKIADFFGMDKIYIRRHIANGKRLDLVYLVLSNDDLTIKEKRDYLFYKTSLSSNMKINLWERFTGDFGYNYCKSGSYSLEFEIIQEGGAV